MNTNKTTFLIASLAALLLAGLVPRVHAQSYEPYTFSMFAGNPPGSVNGTGSAARFSSPRGVAVDSAGNTYVADTSNHTIRMITSAGEVSTFAGLVGTPGSADGTGSLARFNFPQGLAVDTAGNVYVADTNNNTIRQITPAGVVSTLAGLAGSFGTVDGTGSAARFGSPSGVAVDSAGNVYVGAIGATRKIAPGGVVTTFGPPSSYTGVAVDSSGNLYGVDGSGLNNTINKISPAGALTIIAGSGGFGGSGSADGIGSAARFNGPSSIAVDSAGNLYVTDSFNATIRKVTSAGEVSTLAGAPGSLGSADGTGSLARFNFPRGLAIDTAGNLYVADTTNATIRKITGSTVTTMAGSASVGYAEGAASAARFNGPYDVAVDTAGNTYVTDRGNNAIRKISPAGVVSTLAGGSGAGSANGTGSAAQFSGPSGVAVDSAGNVYVADNHTIRKVTPAGDVTTLAGLAGNFGSADGTGSAARFNFPFGLTVDSMGNVYVADFVNRTIRKITPGGVVTTLAGLAGAFGPVDGTGSAARFVAPRAVAVDSAGVVYVLDGSIRKITAGGVVTTLATTGLGFLPNGIAVDSAGSIYVASTFSQTILKITPAGAVTIAAGLNFISGSVDGTGAAARFENPSGIAVDSAGKVYVADTGNNAIRTGSLLPAVTTPVGSAVMLNAGTAGTTGIDLTIGQVTQAGATTVSLINPDYAGGLPSGYQLAEANLSYEISTTAIYQGPVLVRFQVSVDPATFSQLRVLHNENGTLVDRTATDPAPDATTQTIYALVPSLSPFVIAKLVPSLTATVQPPINRDGSSVFTVKRGVVPVKFTLSSGGSAICTLPPATIAVTRTAGRKPGVVDESVYSDGRGHRGSNFRIDKCQYVYDLDSRALGVGTYRADIKINGSVVGTAFFQLK